MSIALVAGGTSGIGLATARRLQQRGYDVHVTGRGKERLDDVASSDPELTRTPARRRRRRRDGRAGRVARDGRRAGGEPVRRRRDGADRCAGPRDAAPGLRREVLGAPDHWSRRCCRTWPRTGSITLLSAITARAAMAGNMGGIGGAQRGGSRRWSNRWRWSWHRGGSTRFRRESSCTPGVVERLPGGGAGGVLRPDGGFDPVPGAWPRPTTWPRWSRSRRRTPT